MTLFWPPFLGPLLLKSRRRRFENVKLNFYTTHFNLFLVWHILRYTVWYIFFTNWHHKKNESNHFRLTFIFNDSKNGIQKQSLFSNPTVTIRSKDLQFSINEIKGKYIHWRGTEIDQGCNRKWTSFNGLYQLLLSLLLLLLFWIDLQTLLITTFFVQLFYSASIFIYSYFRIYLNTDLKW